MGGWRILYRDGTGIVGSEAHFRWVHGKFCFHFSLCEIPADLTMGIVMMQRGFTSDAAALEQI